MSIFLIRHGETRDNARRVLQMPDSALSEVGLAQASMLAERLADQPIGLIISSDYLRTQQTAESVNQYHHLPVFYSPYLRERDFGEWRGRTYEQVGSDLLNDELSPPDGEDKAAFFDRVAAGWEFIQQQAQAAEGDTVLISHGLFCRALVQNHIPLNGELSMPARWLNTSVTQIDFIDDEYRVGLINCDSHLVELNTQDSGSIA